jgi:hypothetical protein
MMNSEADMCVAQSACGTTAWRERSRLSSTEQRATLHLWESGPYAVLAAAISLAIALLLFPMVTFAVIVTSGAAVSAGIAWLLFARQRDRSMLARLMIVSLAAAMLFVMSPFPIWCIMRPASIAIDPGLAHVFQREALAAVVAMFDAILMAPFVFVASIAGTALYWVLRSLVVWACQDN